MAEIAVECPGEHVALVRLNRPEMRNALNLLTRRLLAEHVSALGALDTALLLERKTMHLRFASRERKAGVDALLAKRKPRFEGR
jgi:enoyl-CoA hydratase/carnithine racemase